MSSTTTTQAQTTLSFPSGAGRRLTDQNQAGQSEETRTCPVCPPQSRPNTEITSVSVEESQAFPIPRNDPQPPHWNQQLRGNPPYRRLNRNQDFQIRPLGSNGGEFTFLCFMLTGVMLQNWANMAWRGTVGKLTQKIFRFKVGGTW